MAAIGGRLRLHRRLHQHRQLRLRRVRRARRLHVRPARGELRPLALDRHLRRARSPPGSSACSRACSRCGCAGSTRRSWPGSSGLALMGLARNLTDDHARLARPQRAASPRHADNLPYYYVILAMLFVTLARAHARHPLAHRPRVPGHRPEPAGGPGVGHQPDPLPGHQLHAVVRVRRLAGRLLRPLLRDPHPGRHAHLAHRRDPRDRLHRWAGQPVGRRAHRVPARGSAWSSCESSSPTCRGSTSSCTGSCSSW